MGVRMARALDTQDGRRDDLAMCQHLRHSCKVECAGLLLSPLLNFVEQLEREVFKVRTPIGDQNFAHRAGNIDSRSSVAIAPLDKHRFEFGEQASDALAAENADRHPIKKHSVPSHLVNSLKP